MMLGSCSRLFIKNGVDIISLGYNTELLRYYNRLWPKQININYYFVETEKEKDIAPFNNQMRYITNFLV